MDIDAITLSDKERQDSDEDGLTAQKPKRKAIQRPRAPKVSLEHLQSPLGIPTLHDKFLDAFRARLKGPGNEAADLNTIISMYEAWQKRVYKYCQLDEFLKKAEKISGIQDVLKDMRDVLSQGPKDEVLNPPPDKPTASSSPAEQGYVDLVDDDELIAMQKGGGVVPEDIMFEDLGHGAFDDFPSDMDGDAGVSGTPAATPASSGVGTSSNGKDGPANAENNPSPSQRAVNGTTPPKKRLPQVLELNDDDLQFLDDIGE